MKACSKCKIVLPETDFYKMASARDGLRPSCKACDLKHRDKGKRRAYEQNYWSDRKSIKARIIKKSTSLNKEHHAEVMALYRTTEQFKSNHRNHSAIRRARMKQAFVEHVNYRDVYSDADGKCFYCGISLTFEQSEYDHYIPISKGGPHAKDNIRCSCSFCNKSKGAKLPEAVTYQVV